MWRTLTQLRSVRDGRTGGFVFAALLTTVCWGHLQSTARTGDSEPSTVVMHDGQPTDFFRSSLIASLDSIRTGSVEFLGKRVNIESGNPKVVESYHGIQAFDYNNGRLRFDYKFDIVAGWTNAEKEAMQIKFARTRDCVIGWGGPHTDLARRPPDYKLKTIFQPFDVRSASLCTTGSWAHRPSWEAVRKAFEDIPVTECKPERDGTVSLVSSRSSQDGRVRWQRVVQVDPHRGCVPVRVEDWLRSKSGVDLYLDQVTEATWSRLDGVWVPTHLELRHGKELEELELRWTSVNAELDDELFLVDGFGLPPGTRIVDFRLGTPVVERIIGSPETRDLGSLGPGVHLRWALVGLGLGIPIAIYVALVAYRARWLGIAGQARVKRPGLEE